MKHLLFMMAAIVFLTGCAGAKVMRLRHPDTGQIVKCWGSLEMPEQIEVNRCIYDYKQAGYKPF